MPQLDRVTFFSQFFWFSLVYFLFYFTVSKYFLPTLSRIFKFRKKKMSLSQQGVTSMQREQSKVSESLQALVERGVNASKRLFKQNLEGTQLWLENGITTSNRTHWKAPNQSYLFSLGKKTMSQGLPLSLTFLDFSDQMLLYLLLSTTEERLPALG